MKSSSKTFFRRLICWLESNLPDEKERLRLSMGGTATAMLAAHAFSFFNFIPQHDALTESFWQSVPHVVGLGRCLLPVYMYLRGNAPMPWVTGMLSALYMGLSVYYISRTLHMDTRSEILLTGGFLSANICVLSINALFQFCFDAYMFSLLMSCLGVWLLRQGGLRNYVFAAVCFFISVGVYTAFITVALCLAMSSMLRDTIEHSGIPAKQLKVFAAWAAVFAAAAALYLLACRVSLSIVGTEASVRKTSVFSLGSVGLKDLVYRTGVNYYFFVAMQFLGCSPIHGTECVGIPFGIAGSLLAGICLVSFLRRHKGKLCGAAYVLAAAEAAVFPLIARLVPILTGNGGSNHTAFGQYLLFPLLLWLFFFRREEDKRPRSGAAVTAVVLLSAAIILGNVRFSNEAYTLQKVIYDRAVYHTGRVMSDLHEAGYDAEKGDTVIVSGSFSLGPDLAPELRKFDEAGVGGFYDTSITYSDTFRSMARLLGCSFRPGGESDHLDEQLLQMPAYPKDGYLKEDNGTFIIKLG